MKKSILFTYGIAVLLTCNTVEAQIFTAPLQASTTGTNPVDFEFRADGTMIAKGNYGVGTLLSTDKGAGTRLLWFPSVGAFRAGQVTGTSWDQPGQYSAAFGYNTNAGVYSAAFGYATLANNYSAAFGNGTSATGPYALAAGSNTTASGYWSVAFGNNTSALNYCSCAFGQGTTSSGYQSFAAGAGTTASGGASAAFGLFTQAQAFNAFTVGVANIGGTGSSSASDPLFEVGNGYVNSPTNIYRSDALVVYRNGNAVFSPAFGAPTPPAGTPSCTVSAPAFVTTTPGGTGDIPMYTGN